ncbi:MAG: B12-binding domain-containing radical SAM protein [Candidatus Bathyarchaeia archaeon]
MKSLIVDCLSAVKGQRRSTLDVIGAGPRAIAGVLEDKNINVDLVRAEAFLYEEYPLDDYDTLLISGMTSDLHAVRDVVEEWKERVTGPVLLGGPIAAEPVRMLRKTKADIVIVGEGEKTLEELLEIGIAYSYHPDREELEGVRGIAYVKSGQSILNPLRPVMSRDDYNRYHPSTSIISSYPLHHAARVYVEILRGCSNYRRARIGSLGELCTYCNQCTEGDLRDRYYCPQDIPPGCGYCSVPSLYGPPKSRSVCSIVDEVKELLGEEVRRFVLSAPGFLDYGRELLVDPEPLTDPRRPEPYYKKIEELLASITGLTSFQEGEASLLIENVKASLVTERAARIMGRYLNDIPVSIGFETGSHKHSMELGRPSTPRENLTAIRRLSSAGLKPYVYFIHGLPGQDEETVDRTVEAMSRSVENGSRRIILYRFRSLPMSSFANEPSGPPSVHDPQSRRIYEAATKANLEIKETLLGRVLRVVVAEPYDRDPRLYVAYPMKHGPVILVEDAEGRVGDVIDVKVTGIESERLLRGRVIR